MPIGAIVGLEEQRPVHVGETAEIGTKGASADVFDQDCTGCQITSPQFGPIDAIKRTMDIELPKLEIATRLKKWKAPKPRYTRGVLAKYAKLVSSASEGFLLRIR